MEKFIYVLIFYLVTNIVTYMAYFIDKRKSIKGKYRTKEKTLLLMTFLFGGVGSFFGLYQLRHKNKKWYFVFVTIISIIIQFVLLYYLYKYLNRG